MVMVRVNDAGGAKVCWTFLASSSRVYLKIIARRARLRIINEGAVDGLRLKISEVSDV